MCRQVPLIDHGKMVRRGCQIWALVTAVVTLLLGFPSVVPAQPDDPILSGGVAMTLENRIETFIATGRAPMAGGANLNIFLLPVTNATWPAVGSRAVARDSHAEMLRASGKVLIAGGVGKRGLVFSAEMYDLATDTWLARSQVSTGRGQSSSALPNNGRVLVWCGVIIPF